MRKVRITESQLRGIVRGMIKENVEKETSSIATIVKYYNQSNNNKLKQKISNYGNSRLPENPNHKQLYDFLNKIGDKNKLEMIKKMLEKDIESKSINESQLKGLVKRMIREESGRNYTYFGDEGRELFYDLVTPDDGPLTDIAIVFRAIEGAINAGPSKADLYAHVLLDALDELKKSGGRIESDEDKYY
jgi:hypothetical protein